MANKRPKPEEIVSKLRQVEVLIEHVHRPVGFDEMQYMFFRPRKAPVHPDNVRDLYPRPSIFKPVPRGN